MNYLQDQVVMNFAGSAARGSAIGTAVQEGMVSFLNSTDNVEAYNGSAWQPLAYGSAVAGVDSRVTATNVRVTSLEGSVTSIDGRVTSLEGTRPGTSGKPLQFSANTLTTSASAQVTVTFPSGRFGFRPFIVAQVLGHPNVTIPYIGAADNVSFTIGAFTTAGARVAATVDWHAVQMTSGASGG
jgi:hypothetical protein